MPPAFPLTRKLHFLRKLRGNAGGGRNLQKTAGKNAKDEKKKPKCRKTCKTLEKIEQKRRGREEEERREEVKRGEDEWTKRERRGGEKTRGEAWR